MGKTTTVGKVIATPSLYASWLKALIEEIWLQKYSTPVPCIGYFMLPTVVFATQDIDNWRIELRGIHVTDDWDTIGVLAATITAQVPLAIITVVPRMSPQVGNPECEVYIKASSDFEFYIGELVDLIVEQWAKKALIAKPTQNVDSGEGQRLAGHGSSDKIQPESSYVQIPSASTVALRVETSTDNNRHERSSKQVHETGGSSAGTLLLCSTW